ncbi:hypothetical protein BLSMQ_0579 [Brevibacterium aurantiacum]|uniref:Uncharacterized protein n=1 Tax=Brevibacterium aurantiacum TaxID=273384 RepID=A0A1D7VZW3_BREAU|nr:hypothetical protein BLSMQ_0579 [Brevibacterium aurantiacum]
MPVAAKPFRSKMGSQLATMSVRVVDMMTTVQRSFYIGQTRRG